MISKQLQGEIPGLKGFSPSNMKNMRIFFEEWSSELETNRQALTADLQEKTNNDDGSLIRQTLSAELGEVKMLAFYRVGFSHHREILRKCKSSSERWYYILRCADEFWSYRNLKNHLLADEYTKYGSLPNNFALTIPDEKTAAIALRSFKDEYLIDYIDIKESDDYTERDVEDAIFLIDIWPILEVNSITIFYRFLTFYDGSLFIRFQFIEWDTLNSSCSVAVVRLPCGILPIIPDFLSS